MTTLSGLAMSWQEWHKHDAVALAELALAEKLAAAALAGLQAGADMFALSRALRR
jgi:hypothetical protein